VGKCDAKGRIHRRSHTGWQGRALIKASREKKNPRGIYRGRQPRRVLRDRREWRTPPETGSLLNSKDRPLVIRTFDSAAHKGLNAQRTSVPVNSFARSKRAIGPSPSLYRFRAFSRPPLPSLRVTLTRCGNNSGRCVKIDKPVIKGLRLRAFAIECNLTIRHENGASREA